MTDNAVVSENKAVVRKWFDHLSAMQLAEAWDLDDPEGLIWIPRSRDEMRLGDWHGAYERLMAQQFPEAGVQFTIGTMVGEEDLVSVDTEGVGRMANGNTYHNFYHWRFTVRGGRIVGLLEYMDTLHAEQTTHAAGWAGPRAPTDVGTSHRSSECGLLAFNEAGSGEDVLLFHHGYLGSSSIWDGVVEPFAATHRCIAVDARGIGRSPRAEEGYTIEQMAADVLDLADALGIGRFTFVGHSMGGVVGYQLVTSAADRLNRLVLVCPGASGGPRPGLELFAPFRDAWRTSDVEAMAALLARPSVVVPDPAHLRTRAEVACAAAVGHVEELLRTIASVDLREALPGITLPTFVIAGASDPAIAATIDDFRRQPAAALHVLPGVGHVPQLEAVDEFCHQVGRFLDRTSMSR